MPKGVRNEARLDVQPLEHYLRRRFELVDFNAFKDRTHVPSVATYSRLVGVHPHTWKAWAVAGITERAADRAAVNLGIHPGCIWPELAPQGVS